MGTYQGSLYLVSELLEGETLREHIKRGRLTVRKATDYGVQLARGLAAAHEKGIVHRDLKPENLIVTKDGRLKILDFGLAKLIQPQSGSEHTTLTLPEGTEPGVMMGTVGYMSPEQVRGQTADHRADIFAFGAILYEMLVGKRAFQKSTLAETMSAILNEDPQGISQVTTSIPPALQRVVHRCLEKNLEQRFQSASDLAFALDALSDSGGPTNPLERAKIRPKPFLKGIAAVAVPSLVAAVMMLGVYRTFFEHSRQPFQLPMRRLTSTEKSQLAACSPDGRYLVHVVQEGDLQSLWLVDVGNERNMQIVAPDVGRYQGLVFSADSQNVYYSESLGGSGALYQVPIFGGSPRKLIPNVSSPIALSWDGKQFAFLRPAGDETTLFVAAANPDGNERSVSTGKFFGGPAWSPDGKTIALLAGKTGSPIADLIEVPVSGGPERLISREDWSYNGRIAWLRNGAGLVLQASDPAFNTQLWLVTYPGGGRQRITNDLAKYESVTVTADSKFLTTIRTDEVSTIWIAAPGGEARQITLDGPKREGKGGVVWTRNGKILYTSFDASNTVNIWVMDADGRDRGQLTSSSRNNFFPAVAKDGQTVVFVSNRTGHANIWKMDIDGGHQTQLTYGDADYRPQLSPDGNWLLYTRSSAHSNMGTLLRIGMNGDDPTPLGTQVWLDDLSADGKLLVLQTTTGSAIVPFTGGEPTRFINVPKTHTYLPEGSPPVLWSPDGSALTYVETSNGVSNIWRGALARSSPWTSPTVDEIHVRPDFLVCLVSRWKAACDLPWQCEK